MDVNFCDVVLQDELPIRVNATDWMLHHYIRYFHFVPFVQEKYKASVESDIRWIVQSGLSHQKTLIDCCVPGPASGLLERFERRQRRSEQIIVA